jgi:hypothetical protein
MTLEYKITLDHEKNLVRMTCWGILKIEEAPKSAREARILADKHGYRLLFDYRGVDLHAKTGQIYQYPREVDHLLDNKLRRIKTALLVSNGPQLKDFRFFETTARNTGVNVRIFPDNELGALAWLAE